MPLPPIPARPSRLSGFAIALLLVAPLLSPPGGAQTGRTSPEAASQSWLWPVGPAHAIVRPFIAPATPYAAGHRGVDIAAETGAVVRSPADGVVHFAGPVVDRTVLSIRHPGGLISSFEPVEPMLAAGAPVARGDPIATVVAGHCAGSCLHFGVRLHGEYVSPLGYLGGIPLSVLLPTRPLD